MTLPPLSDSEREFAVSLYTATRTHELELDKVTGQYEVALVQGLFVLNGAAAAAFIALISSNLTLVGARTGFWIAAALATWLYGLLLAGVTGVFAYQAQVSFVGAVRARRHATALRVMGRNDAVLGIDPVDNLDTLTATYSTRQSEGDDRFKRANQVGIASSICFFAGAVAAAIAVLAPRLS